MSRKETSKEIIVRLFKNGKSATDIIREYNFPKATVYAAISEYKKTIIHQDLTINNYVAAHRMGIRSKNDLAAFFGVSRMSINRFENRPEIKHHFARYMELQNSGYELNKLLQYSTAILETITPFEPDSAVTSTLRQVITLLSKCDKKNN